MELEVSGLRVGLFPVPVISPIIPNVSLLKLSLFIFIACLSVGFLLFSLETHHSSSKSPDGYFTAIVTYKSYLSALPMMPGSSSDKPCFVEIVDSTGTSMGKIPVPMLQMAIITWGKNKASIKMVGEWDFMKNSCYYWEEYGNQKIIIKNPPNQ